MTIMARKAQLAKADLPEARPITAAAVWTRPIEETAAGLGVVITDLSQAEAAAGIRGLLLHTSTTTPPRMALAASLTPEQRDQTARRLLWKQIVEPVGPDRLVHIETETSDADIAVERACKVAAAELAAHPTQPTVPVRFWDGTEATVPEQHWCSETHMTGQHPDDLRHASSPLAACLTRLSGERELIVDGFLLEYPFSADEPGLRVAIGLPGGDVDEHVDPASLDRLAAELRAAAALVEHLRHKLAAERADR